MRTLQRRFALIRRYVLGVLLLVPLFFAPGTQPQAAIVQIDDNKATGILGLSVGPDTFDVAFIFGLYNDVYPGGVLFPTATNFVDAINSALNLALTPIGNPPLIFPGPQFSFKTNSYFLPQSTQAGGDLTIIRGICPVPVIPVACIGPYFQFLINTTTPSPNGVWAVLDPIPVSPVPLPAALPLFGSALAMLGIVGWRRKQRGDA